MDHPGRSFYAGDDSRCPPRIGQMRTVVSVLSGSYVWTACHRDGTLSVAGTLGDGGEPVATGLSRSRGGWGRSVVSDLVLQPHCDLHMTLSGTPQLKLRLFRREDTPGNPKVYRLTPILPAPPPPAPPPPPVVVDFFAPHSAATPRLHPAILPSVNPLTGEVTARALGVFLFQVRVGQEYMVGRLQVH